MHLLRSTVSALVLALAVLTASTVSAHSLTELESKLGDEEKYFQPVDKEAPTFTLRNADGETVRLDDFRGKAVVLHFIYASCPDVCPLHAERIAEIQERVNQTPMKAQVQFVSITTDPVNDTAEVLRRYGSAHSLAPANWTFLTTTPEQAEDATRRLAESYGHKFTKTDDAYQVHGVVTHIIDKESRWRANFHGLRFEPTNLTLYIHALVNDVCAPHRHGKQRWWDKLKSLF